MFTKKFWKDSTERAIKSAAQGTVAVIVAGNVTNALEVDWSTIGGGAILMGVLSYLTSLGSVALSSENNISLTKE